jgi:predicted RNase H-like HicB family nuclease
MRHKNMGMTIFTAFLHKEGNLYVAQCLEVGTASQGYTLEEALTNLKEATELYLEEFPLPKMDGFLGDFASLW